MTEKTPPTRSQCPYCGASLRATEPWCPSCGSANSLVVAAATDLPSIPDGNLGATMPTWLAAPPPDPALTGFSLFSETDLPVWLRNLGQAGATSKPTGSAATTSTAERMTVIQPPRIFGRSASASLTSPVEQSAIAANWMAIAVAILFFGLLAVLFWEGLR